MLSLGRRPIAKLNFKANQRLFAPCRVPPQSRRAIIRERFVTSPGRLMSRSHSASNPTRRRENPDP